MNNASHALEYSCVEYKSQYHNISRYKTFRPKMHFKNETNFKPGSKSNSSVRQIMALFNVGVIWNVWKVQSWEVMTTVKMGKKVSVPKMSPHLHQVVLVPWESGENAHPFCPQLVINPTPFTQSDVSLSPESEEGISSRNVGKPSHLEAGFIEFGRREIFRTYCIIIFTEFLHWILISQVRITLINVPISLNIELKIILHLRRYLPSDVFSTGSERKFWPCFLSFIVHVSHNQHSNGHPNNTDAPCYIIFSIILFFPLSWL